jgi:cobalt/nickel transport protein
MSTTKPFGRAAASLLLGLTLLLAALPVALARGAAFQGTDDQARAAVAELAPGYQPWAAPLFSPPSSSVESTLFALQAALGAGLIGYYFGLKRGQRQAARASTAEADAQPLPCPGEPPPAESQATDGRD